MSSIEADDRINQTENYDVSSCSGIPLPDESTTHFLVSLGITLNFIGS